MYELSQGKLSILSDNTYHAISFFENLPIQHNDTALNKNTEAHEDLSFKQMESFNV
jgi:hypothetical protein